MSDASREIIMIRWTPTRLLQLFLLFLLVCVTSLGSGSAGAATPPPAGFIFSYSGARYYVAPGGVGISTLRARPGNAATTIRSAKDGSRVIFLAGTYPSINITGPAPGQVGALLL